MGMQTDSATVENSMEFLKKLKIEQFFDPAIPGYWYNSIPVSKNPETPIQKNLCTPMFTAA